MQHQLLSVSIVTSQPEPAREISIETPPGHYNDHERNFYHGKSAELCLVPVTRKAGGNDDQKKNSVMDRGTGLAFLYHPSPPLGMTGFQCCAGGERSDTVIRRYLSPQ